MRSVGAFMQGLAGGVETARDRRLAAEAKADREEERKLRQEELDFRRSARDIAAPSGGAPGGSGSSDPYVTNDPATAGMAPHQKAFLNAVAGGESGGAYNVRYTPNGAATFDSFDAHPRIFEAGPEGPSSAAGRYQFTATTWHDYGGGGSFTPERQDMAAWKLASDRYRASTGRNLDQDLQARGLDTGIISALSPTWAAFKANQNRHIATYNDSFRRYSSAPQPAAAAAAEGDPKTWGTLRRYMTT